MNLETMIKKVLKKKDEDICCPFCENGNLNLNNERNYFFCFRCQTGGNPEVFVMKYFGVE